MMIDDDDEASLYLHTLPLHVPYTEHTAMHGIVVTVQQWRTATVRWIVIAIIWLAVQWAVTSNDNDNNSRGSSSSSGRSSSIKR